LLRELFRKTGWCLLEAEDAAGGIECLDRYPVHVVIAESEAPGDETWKTLLRRLAAFEHPPKLIVASLMADDRLWAEVLNFGGFDVLAQPFEPNEVERSVAYARRHFDPHPVRHAPAAKPAVA
jgi:DNA-binding response OmpR family regulator